MYEYTFAIHISSHGMLKSCGSLKEIFSMTGLFTMTFTEDEFMSFMHELLIYGIELHEITRVPYIEPETVII